MGMYPYYARPTTRVLNATASPPVADFTFTPTIGDDPLTVTADNTTTGDVDTWSWKKSSNSGETWVAFAGTPTAFEPSEDLSAGTWSIQLTATGPGGVNVKERIDYITVNAA